MLARSESVLWNKLSLQRVMLLPALLSIYGTKLLEAQPMAATAAGGRTPVRQILAAYRRYRLPAAEGLPSVAPRTP